MCESAQQELDSKCLCHETYRNVNETDVDTTNSNHVITDTDTTPACTLCQDGSEIQNPDRDVSHLVESFVSNEILILLSP